MTAGILSTILILPEPRLSAAAVLFLLLGDGVASLAGMTLGGPHWGSSPRRISGSAACLLVCLITGVVLLRPEFPWNGILIGAVVATVVEGVGIPNLNDNFLIPLTSAIVFFLTYILSAN
jgi:dolichol kinase